MSLSDRIKPLVVSAGLAFALLAGCSEDRTEETAPGAAGAGPTGSAAYGLNVEISAPDGAEDLDEAAMVYVFLRKPGTRMPLALQHFPAGELPKAVGFLGGDPEEAVELVVRLSPSGQVTPSPEDVEVVEALSGLLHPPQTVTVVLDGAGSVQAGSVAPHVPVEAPTQIAPIRARVTIDGPHEFAADTVVFVIARKPGQAMPTAVRRLSVAELPAEIELTDQDSMTVSNRLSGARSLDLLARVSATGTASQTSADWQSDVVRVDTAQLPELLALTIRRPESP